jgi:L-aminopeptidase/D-esterase-like protein
MRGPKNLITDVPGVLVGNADNAELASGVTVALFEGPVVAAVAVPGGAPGTRETDLLDPAALVPGVDAIVLSGGSAFGLDAASGVQAWLRSQGRGFAVGPVRVPLVSQAICFDLLNGGRKEWERYPPYRELGYAAAEGAGEDFALGTAGGGHGATTVNLKGGLGSASAQTPSGFTVGALALVNAIGSAVIGIGPHFWAAPFEEGEEFGGLGAPRPFPPEAKTLAWKGGPPGTTLAVVATDAALSKAMTKRLALAAQGGIAKALSLSYALSDGDTVFAVATGRRPVADERGAVIELGAVAANCLARAIARGVFEASALPFAGALPSWLDEFGAASPS